MGRLGVIGGHSILGAEPSEGFELRSVATPHGRAELLDGDGFVLLQRHGLGRYVSAPAIEHRANLAALAALGCDRVIALGSVGGLRREHPVGTFVCPDDFIALQLGLTSARGGGGERVPGFDPAWRRRVVAVWERVAEPRLRDGGVYWQAIGPRFETPAEIAMLAPRADVIGMTIASECVVAGELGIAYAAVCVVDNLANGVAAEPLSRAEFEAGKARNRGSVTAVLEAILPELAAEGAGWG